MLRLRVRRNMYREPILDTSGQTGCFLYVHAFVTHQIRRSEIIGDDHAGHGCCSAKRFISSSKQEVEVFSRQ